MARRRSLTTQEHDGKFWSRGKGTIGRRRCEQSTEYRKAELDAAETGVGYNTGAPHELYVPWTGHEHPAEVSTLRSPVELTGNSRYA